MASKKLVLNAAGDAATVAEATVADIFTTLLSSSEALTGMYKYAQVGLVGAGAAMFMNKRHTGAFLNFGG